MNIIKMKNMILSIHICYTNNLVRGTFLHTPHLYYSAFHCWFIQLRNLNSRCHQLRCWLDQCALCNKRRVMRSFVSMKGVSQIYVCADTLWSVSPVDLDWLRSDSVSLAYNHTRDSTIFSYQKLCADVNFERNRKAIYFSWHWPKGN